MTSYKITINDMNGLTSRSSAELVEEANHHKCHITLKIENGEECDLKSIMNVFALSPISKGEVITIECDGEDEVFGGFFTQYLSTFHQAQENVLRQIIGIVRVIYAAEDVAANLLVPSLIRRGYQVVSYLTDVFHGSPLY